VFVTFVGPTISSSALYVLDAITGTLCYTLPIPEGLISMMPTVVQDQISGNVTAFVADGSQLSAVSLGSVSGSVLWTQTGEFGGDSISTVVGTSVVVAGQGQYYAFDEATGAVNHFWSGNISGGGRSNNTRVIGLWTIDQDRNAWAYLQGAGWRKIAWDNDNILFDLLRLLAAAKEGARPINVYQNSGVIKQIYVL